MPPFHLRKKHTRHYEGILTKEKKGATEIDEWEDNFKVCNSPGVAANFILMNELHDKISTFRNLLDFQPCNGSSSVNELIKCTLKDLYKTYPQIRETLLVKQVDSASILQLYDFFCIAIGSLGDLWANRDEWKDKSKIKSCHKLDLDELEELVFAKLEVFNKLASGRSFDMMDEDEQLGGDCSPPYNSTACGKLLSNSDNKKSLIPSSPETPASVLPVITRIASDGIKIKVVSPSLFSLRVQAIGKLNPIDVKRLSFHMFPHVASQDPNVTIQYIDSVMEVHRVETVHDFLVEQPAMPEESKDRCSDRMSIDTRRVQVKETPYSDVNNDYMAVTYSYLKRMHPKVDEKDGPAPVTPSSAELFSIPNGEDSQMSPRQPVSPHVSPDSKVTTIQLKPPSPPVSPSVSPEVRLTSTHVSIPIDAPSSQPLQTQSSLVASKNPVSVPLLQPRPAPPPPHLPSIPSKYMSFSPSPPPGPPVPPKNIVTPPSPLPFPMPNLSVFPPPPPPFGGQNVAPPPPPPRPPVPSNNIVTPPSPPPFTKLNLSVCPPPPPPFGGQNMAPPPLPPPMGARDMVPPPPLLGKGGAPPPAPPVGKGGKGAPPPPLGLTGVKNLHPEKAVTKLKRSPQMGNLYRGLKGKVEGSCLTGKTQAKGKVGAPAGGKQGSDDAIAELRKRSPYQTQIEEDVKNHETVIMEMKVTINSFQTSDMPELIKFHKSIEFHVDKLVDESQVLANFSDFPTKKLEVLRVSAALYSKLKAILQTLQNWQIVSPVNKVLDKIDSYFTKFKIELDAVERTKDEEAKKFKSHKINFDFRVLIHIKEAMVAFSSSCMELALKERREGKAKVMDQNIKPNKLFSAGKKNGSSDNYMWRTFEFAYRVYLFSGGHDDRADMLAKELAHEIETDPHS